MRKLNMTTIYLDVVFAENVWMNAIILFATSLCLKKKVRKRNVLTSAVLGASYTVLTCLFSIAGIGGMIGKIGISMGMVEMAFRPKKLKELMSNLIWFYLVSILFGGCALLISLAFSEAQMKQGVWHMKASLPIILSSALPAYLLWKIGVKMLQKKEKQKKYEMELWYQGKCQKCKAFLDTGNGLKDPMTKEPVIILEEQCFCSLFAMPEYSLWGTMLATSQLQTQIRMIPFQAVGKKEGMLFAMQAEKLYLPEFESQKQPILVAMQEGVFSKRGEYQALIGPAVLERSRKKDGFITNSKRAS